MDVPLKPHGVMKMARRTYTARDGTVYPLKEAPIDMLFKAYRSDFRKAVIGDPWDCIESKGIKHHRGVLEAYIGSGRNAYIVMRETEDEPATAYHYMISVRAGKLRDNFEQNKKLDTQLLLLRAPAKTQTLEARSVMNKKRYAAIKNGTHVPGKRGKPNTTRMARIGAPHRPRPDISRGGSVTTEEAAA
jgi:hypothetical protein